MSETPAAAAETKPPAAGTPGKTSKAVLLLLVLNLGASGFATFKLTTAEAAPAHAAEPAPANAVEGPIVPLDAFVVNLDEPGTARYLKVTVQVELANAEAEPLLEKNKQVVRDGVLSYLSGLHVKDTLGVDGKDKIRKDVMATLDKVLGPGKVHRLFFQDFVVQ